MSKNMLNQARSPSRKRLSPTARRYRQAARAVAALLGAAFRQGAK